MAKLLPQDSLTIHSELGGEAIAQRLAPFVSPRPLIRWAWDKQKTPYHGTLSPEGFELTRAINYRNSFIPVIKGQFKPIAQGTAVHITMAPHPAVMAFCAVWAIGWYGISIPLLLFGEMDGIFMLFPVMPLVMGFVFWAAFWAEAKRSRRDLIHMIDGRLAKGSLGLA